MRINKISQYFGLMATLAMPACASVTRKDLWKPEKEFTRTIPTGESDASRLQYSVDARQQGQSIELLVNGTKYAERFQHFQVVENIREKKYVEETTTEPANKAVATYQAAMAIVGTGAAITGGLLYANEAGKACPSYDSNTGKCENEDLKNGYAVLAGGGLCLGIFGLITFFSQGDNPKSSSLALHPTDELRISPRGQREMKNRTKQEQVYASKPAAGIEVIAESDFYRLNGSSGRASVLTTADGKASVALELPKGYARSEKELLDVLMPYAESGAMSLKQVKRAVADGTEKHSIQFKTNVQPVSGVNVDNASQSVSLTVYKLP